MGGSRLRGVLASRDRRDPLPASRGTEDAGVPRRGIARAGFGTGYQNAGSRTRDAMGVVVYQVL
jgi:hypothetical protein